MTKKERPPGAEMGAEGNNPAAHVTGMEPEKKEKSNGKNAAEKAVEREAGDGDAISGSGKRTGGRGKSNVHNRDISSKTVFRNPVLCAQLLRDNCDIPALKNVRPEEIEDISERYIPYLGKELESDSVKKIRILDIGAGKKTEGEGDKEPHFLVSLIDHKSLVDYDVSMQLLRYMMCIWTEYRREMETEREGCSGRKSFRYPVIIPVVYYEGKAEWTADRQLSGRIGGSGEYRDWIPDFKYEVIRIHDYSNEELLKRGDEMSLIMMINKIRNASDLEDFIHIPPAELDKIIKDSPGHVLDVIVKVIESLCFKIDVPEEERTQCVQRVRAREMGYLFENMEHMSLQEERRKTEEARQRAEEERQRAEEAEEKLRIAEETIKRLLAKENR